LDGGVGFGRPQAFNDHANLANAAISAPPMLAPLLSVGYAEVASYQAEAQFGWANCYAVLSVFS
jgi:hypothetical protein